jgi:uncharacterized membrane protein
VSVLRLWLAGTAIVLAVVAVWAFAPLLVFAALVTVGLGLLSFAMIRLARLLQARTRSGLP